MGVGIADVQVHGCRIKSGLKSYALDNILKRKKNINIFKVQNSVLLMEIY